MFLVERPFVTEDDEGAAADEHARREQERELVDLGERQAEPLAMTPEREMRVDEAEGVAQAVPPQMDRTDRQEDRIDPMNEPGIHVSRAPAAECRSTRSRRAARPASRGRRRGR